MVKVCLDTSFLASAFDRRGPGHENAVRYLEFWARHPEIVLLVPTVVLAEYNVVGQLDLEEVGPSALLCAFGEQEALLAARLHRAWKARKDLPNPMQGMPGGRQAVKDDFKVLATALAHEAAVVATEDRRTLCAFLDLCKGLCATPPLPLLTTEPFSEDLASGEVQSSLPLG